MSDDILRTLPANLAPMAAPVVPPRVPLETTQVFEVAAGGALSETPVRFCDLWRTGALVVVVRRPGCALSREQAKALSEAFEAVVPDPHAPGVPRLVAIVRGSVTNEEGISEVDAFREYFRGSVFVDEYLATFKALGDRQYTDGIFSLEAARWMLQRMCGTQQTKIHGNFVGGPDTALKFGGCYVFDRQGQIRYVHQEGIGGINYEAVRKALSEA